MASRNVCSPLTGRMGRINVLLRSIEKTQFYGSAMIKAPKGPDVSG